MASQTVPALPTGVPVISSAAKSFFDRKEWQAGIDQLIIDLITLRNAVDTLATNFNAHTHKCNASGSVSSAPASDAAGQTATTPLVNAAPASMASGV